MKEIGMYIHIPFCKSKCYYCDFTSFANKNELVQEYIQCLKKEIINKADYNYLIKTIYIGGGTPSFINEKYIKEIIYTIKKYFYVDEKAEITIEVNPGTVNENKLESYFELGINRLSIGLQTSNDKILNKIGRIHTYKQYENTIKMAKNAGFVNINSDIIIGLPEQTIDDLEATLNKLIDIELTHISVYSLIVEEGTQIAKLLNEGIIKLPDEEIERYMYWFAKRKLEKNGYIHYEISNFSKPGYMSKHNLDCWKQREYIGFGVAASSYENKKRFSNTHCLEDYIENIQKDCFEKNVTLEEEQDVYIQRSEFMILGLRKIKGVNISEFKMKFKENPLELYRKQLKKLSSEELIDMDINNIKLSKKGIDLANIVWKEFI